MPRPPEWLRIARRQHLAEQALWCDACKELELLAAHFLHGNPDAALLQDVASKLAHCLIGGRAINKLVQELLDDNDR